MVKATNMFKCSLPLLILLFVLPICSHAQMFLTGKVKSETGEVIRFATVTLLLQKDSSILKTEMTDSAGLFTIQIVGTQKRLIKVEAIGFRTLLQELSDSMANIDLFLSSTGKTLQKVTVTAKKPVFERKADRLVFNVENSVSSMGSDGLDILKKAPGLRVNDNQIAIVGKSTVSVLLNNRLLQLSNEELAALLKSIPSDQIAKIEIITSPPAKYDAEGNSGIINIVTKKLTNTGLNGSVMGSYQLNTYSTRFLTGNFNYRKGKFNVYGNGNSNDGHLKRTGTTTSYFTNQERIQSNNTKLLNTFNRVQLGIDYAITPRSVIGILGTYGTSGPETNEDFTTRFNNLAAKLVDSTASTQALSHETGERRVFNANYEWKIDSLGKKLNVDLDYFDRTGTNQRDFTTTNFLFEGNAPTGFSSTNKTSGEQVIKIKSAKFDLEWPTSLANFSAGMKTSFIENRSTNIFGNYDGSMYNYDSTKSNRFKYNENTQALYLSMQRSIKKWDLQMGVRAENTQIKTYSATLNKTNTNSYTKLFPSIYIGYKPGKDHSINVSYTRRINRPGFWLLNPFRTYYTYDSYSEGNPFLQPSFSNNIELDYTLLSRYTFKFFVQSINNMVNQISVVDSVNKTLYFQQTNSGKLQNAGFVTNATINPTPWMENSVSLNIFYTRFSSNYYSSQTQSYNQASFYFETINSFFLNHSKTLQAEANFWYQSKQQINYDQQSPYYNVSAGVKVLLLKKRLIVGLNANDPFKTNKPTYKNVYNGTVQKYYYDERYIKAAVTYKFGKASIKSRRQRQTGTGEENRSK